MDLFYQDDYAEGPQSGLGAVVSQTYEESVRDLIHDERHYLRDLHMIIKVKYLISQWNVVVNPGKMKLSHSLNRFFGKKSQN